MFHSFSEKQLLQVCVWRSTPQCRVPFVPAPFSFLLDQPAKEADFYIIWARKVEKYTHSKKNRRLKKTNTRYMLNFVLFSYCFILVFLRALYVLVVVKLGMPSSLQKQDLSCGWTCSLGLGARKQPLLFTSMDTAVTLCHCPGSARTCLMKCFASWVNASQIYIATLHLASVQGPHQDGGLK